MAPRSADELIQESAALRRQGRLDQALSLARTAVAQAPEHLAARKALGVLALEQGLWDEAVDNLRRVQLARPQDPGLRADLGVALRESGDLGAALLELSAAARALPQHPVVLTQLGQTLRLAGRLDEARLVLRQAIVHAPQAPEPRLELGAVELAQGKYAAAEGPLRTALTLSRSSPEAALPLGRVLTRLGRPEEGARVLAAAALQRPVLPLYVALADALAVCSRPPELPLVVMRGLFSQEGVDLQRAARAARLLLPADDAAMMADPLFHALLRRTLTTEPAWERRLRALRRRLVLALASGGEAPLQALESLAIAAWWTEHAWQPEPDTLAAVESLAQGLGPGSSPAHVAAVLTVRSPLDLPEDLVEPLLAQGEQGPLAELLRVSVLADREERRRAQEMPTLVLPQSATSAEVAQRYEDHPYPRLVAFHRLSPTPLAQLLSERFPWVQGWPQGPIEVLLAGCGAGQQTLAALTRYAGARVVGVDLSRRSLARTARLCAERGLGPLELMQADLLALGSWERRFDLIECGGVLHHLDKPLQGGRALRALLKPGGLMKLGLYSARARGDVDAARALADAHGLGASPEPLRLLRDLLLDLPEQDPASPIVRSPDFCSVSGLADLLFHPCERRFTPLQLQGFLQELELEFLGFQHMDGRAEAAYRALFPEDERQDRLERWEQVEIAEPRLFTGMFQFWCRALSPATRSQTAG